MTGKDCVRSSKTASINQKQTALTMLNIEPLEKMMARNGGSEQKDKFFLMN